MWGTRIDSPEAIDRLEKELVSTGYVRVADDAMIESVGDGEFRRRVVPETAHTIEERHSILWHTD